MKRWFSMVLSLLVFLSLTPMVQAADVTPTPPEWMAAGEYAVFADGAAYQKENWDKILRLRTDAAAGHTEKAMSKQLKEDLASLRTLASGSDTQTGSASLCFELGLITLRYRCNAISQKLPMSETSYSGTQAETLLNNAVKYGAGEPEKVYLAYLWNGRNQMLNFCDLYSKSSEDMEAFVTTLQALYEYPQFKSAALLNWDMASLVPAEYRTMVQDAIIVMLDGKVVHPAIITYSPIKHELSAACVKNGWTMVPVRRLAELMGADVSYANGVVTIVRAGVTATMTIGSKIATVGGKTVTMTAAPVKENGRTYIPVRYIGEFFGQDLKWVTPRQLSVTESTEAVGQSNLKDWALPMGAILNQRNSKNWGIGGVTLNKRSSEDVAVFGGMSRVSSANLYNYGQGGKSSVQFARDMLSGSWDIYGREELIDTVCSMTYYGHNDDFLSDAEWINSMTSAQYQALLKDAQGMDAYMFPYTKELYKKWGDKGIVAWDLFRMGSLAQWGYLAGYVTYPEALALLEPAANRLKENFSTWDKAAENYVDGYNWWARKNVLGQDTWQTERGKIYKELKSTDIGKSLFNDALFRTPVTGVPGITAQSLLVSVS